MRGLSKISEAGRHTRERAKLAFRLHCGARKESGEIRLLGVSQFLFPQSPMEKIMVFNHLSNILERERSHGVF